MSSSDHIPIEAGLRRACRVKCLSLLNLS